MPPDTSAASRAAAAREVLRRLAAAGPHDITPEETYAVLGELSGALSSLRAVLDQLAEWHARHSGRAQVAGDEVAGRRLAHESAAGLRLASRSIRAAGTAVDQAWSHNGQTVWTQDAAPPGPRPARRREPPGRPL